MGAPGYAREGADRQRTVKARKQGSTTGPYRTYGLIIPSWLAREIANSDDVDVIEKRIKQLEFLPRKTPEGILYEVTQVVVLQHTGWPDGFNNNGDEDAQTDRGSDRT